jgi:very-short-patch-repair endonuclease
MVTIRYVSDALSEFDVRTAAEWRASGITTGQMRTLVRSGELVRLRYGVYATKRAVASAEGDPCRGHALRAAAVIAAVGRDTVASHHSAAAIHGIDLLDHPRRLVTLTRSPARRGSRIRSDGILFHAAEVPSDHMTKLFGIRVTTVPRTVVDLARTSPFMAAIVTADSALRAGTATKAELEAICGACSQWPGVRQARQVAGFSDRRAESVLESCARVVFHQLKLEPPQLQMTIRGEGFLFRVDFCWPQHRTIAEADGLAKYASKDDILAQFRRDRLLRDAGYKVVHFTWRELFDTPAAVVARVRAAFSSASPF